LNLKINGYPWKSTAAVSEVHVSAEERAFVCDGRAMVTNKNITRPPVTVLVVDDDLAVRNSLKFSLELEGFAVRLYADGRELLDDPDLPPDGCLIVDQVMPGMAGLDVVDAIRRRSMMNPAILIISNTNPKVRNRAAMAGVAVIEKPFFGNELVDAVRDLLALIAIRRKAP
jgi:two-component system, LuxR family, response regulator FixJ